MDRGTTFRRRCEVDSGHDPSRQTRGPHHSTNRQNRFVAFLKGPEPPKVLSFTYEQVAGEPGIGTESLCCFLDGEIAVTPKKPDNGVGERS
jgi:hypothetical protein